MEKFNRTRARLEILNHMFQFCMSRKIDGIPVSLGLDGKYSFESGFLKQPTSDDIGALVALNSAPFSKWYLSWLREIQPRDNGFATIYVLESIEDGELCNWSNVSLNIFDKDEIRRSWKWTDQQFAFNDRWNCVCFKEKDAYIVLPCQPEFHADGSVTLSTRTRFGFDEINPEKTFPSWKKVTKDVMREFYDWAVCERDRLLAEKKNNAA
jgi:hypothetical protein